MPYQSVIEPVKSGVHSRIGFPLYNRRLRPDHGRWSFMPCSEQHNNPISDPSGGAADHQHHLRYTISQASPALRWIAWVTQDRDGIQEGTQAFPPPYLAGYSEFQRTRRLDGSAVITRSAIVDRLRLGSRLLMDEPRCPPGICLSLGMLNMAVPILIITGPVPVSVRLLPSSSFPRVGMPSVSSESPGFLEAVAAVVAAAPFHARRVYPEFRLILYLVWPWLSTPSVEDLLVELPASGVSLGGADPHWNCY